MDAIYPTCHSCSVVDAGNCNFASTISPISREVASDSIDVTKIVVCTTTSSPPLANVANSGNCLTLLANVPNSVSHMTKIRPFFDESVSFLSTAELSALGFETVISFLSAILNWRDQIRWNNTGRNFRVTLGLSECVASCSM